MLLLKGGHLVDPQVGLDAVLDVLVGDDGKICQLGEGIEPAEGCQVVDAAGKYVIPGLVDIHVHFRDPGLEYKETIEGGCRSAAKGGYTDVCTMPNTKPVCDDAPVARDEARRGVFRGSFWQQNAFRSSFLEPIGRQTSFGVVKTLSGRPRGLSQGNLKP